jgi:predicted lipase
MVLNNKKKNILITKYLIVSKQTNGSNIHSLQDQLNNSRTIIKRMEQSTNYYLYNILTDELLQITCQLSELIKIIELLFYNKYFNSKGINDETFLKNISLIKEKYFEKLLKLSSM